MKYKKIKLKRLYNGIASTRDYVWQKCLDNKMGIDFECNGAHMKIPYEELKMADVEKTRHKSKYDGREYSLVNFKWRTNNGNLKLFG